MSSKYNIRRVNKKLVAKNNSSGLEIFQDAENNLIYYKDTNGVLQQLIDTNSLPPTPASGALTTRIDTTTSITALASECIISDSEEAVAVSIPNPTTVKSSEIVVKKINNSESFVTITPSTGTIEGELTFVLRSSNKYVRLISDGVEWHVIANN